jgi:hypothetical protein
MQGRSNRDLNELGVAPRLHYVRFVQLDRAHGSKEIAMNIKALITTLLVLGSSTAAMARPVPVSGYQGAPIVRDHRTNRTPTPPPFVPAPVDAKPLPPPFVPAPVDAKPLPPPFVPAPIEVKPAPPPFVPLWVTLGVENRIVDGAMAFRVHPQMGQFIALKLQHTSGKSLINRVEIKFANGQTQVVAVNKYLNASSPTITVDLAGEAARTIKSVTIVGRNARASEFSILAI